MLDFVIRELRICEFANSILMTKRQIRRAVNIYMAAMLYHGAKEMPDWMTEKDILAFSEACEDRANEVLDRVKCMPVPLTLEDCLKIARDNKNA